MSISWFEIDTSNVKIHSMKESMTKRELEQKFNDVLKEVSYAYSGEIKISLLSLTEVNDA